MWLSKSGSNARSSDEVTTTSTPAKQPRSEWIPVITISEEAASTSGLLPAKVAAAAAASSEAEFKVPLPAGGEKKRPEKKEVDTVLIKATVCKHPNWHHQSYRRGVGQCKHRRLDHWKNCVIPNIDGICAPSSCYAGYAGESYDVLSTVCVETPFHLRKCYPKNYEPQITKLLSIDFDGGNAIDLASKTKQVEGLQLVMDIPEYAQAARNRLHAVLAATSPHLKRHNTHLSGPETAYMLMLNDRLTQEIGDPRSDLVRRVALFHYLRHETFIHGVTQFPLI